MSGYNALKLRIQHLGGNSEGRISKGKLNSMKGALFNSYQAETIEIEYQNELRHFKCLINPDDIKTEYDNKIISIPFYDFCLNESILSKQYQRIPIDVGSIFKWIEDDTYWLVILKLHEKAYFRGEIRRCDNVIELPDGTKQRVYKKGPLEESLEWNKVGNRIWNDLNYNYILYVPATEKNVEFFHRFSLFKMDGQQLQTQIVTKISNDQILQIHAKEYYQNPIEDKANEIEKENEVATEPTNIKGPLLIYPFSENEYAVENLTGGQWKIIQDKNYASITTSTDKTCTINVLTGKSATIKLQYLIGNTVAAENELEIGSL